LLRKTFSGSVPFFFFGLNFSLGGSDPVKRRRETFRKHCYNTGSPHNKSVKAPRGEKVGPRGGFIRQNGETALANRKKKQSRARARSFETSAGAMGHNHAQERKPLCKRSSHLLLGRGKGNPLGQACSPGWSKKALFNLGRSNLSANQIRKRAAHLGKEVHAQKEKLRRSYTDLNLALCHSPPQRKDPAQARVHLGF